MDEDWQDGDVHVEQLGANPNHLGRTGKKRYDNARTGYIPIDPSVRWIDATHNTHDSRILTELDPRYDGVLPGFRGELFPPQATVLQAMLNLEASPRVKTAAWGAATIQTRCGRINAAFSFGKTVLSLALACVSPVPSTHLPFLAPTFTRCEIKGNPLEVYSTHNDPFGGKTTVFLPEVSMRYTRLLPVTVVAASNNVISQWENETRRFTSKLFFTIENVKTLTEFSAWYNDGRAATLDLIFVKAGRVTSSFSVPGEKKGHPGSNRSMFEALGRILEGVTVGRLIIDDYDTLKLGSSDPMIPALFTWFISATRRSTTVNQKRPWIMTSGMSLADYFRWSMPGELPVLAAALDDVLNSTLSLNCSETYVANHINSNAIKYRVIGVSGGLAAVLLRDLGVAPEVVEMVNANAVNTAAQTLGMSAVSLGDVIRRVVGDQLDKVRRAVRTIARVAVARETMGTARDRKTAGEVIADSDALDMHELRRALKNYSDPDVDAFIGRAGGLTKKARETLESLEQWAIQEKDKYGASLNRMRDNIRQGECQCCMVPFGPADNTDDTAKADEGAAYVLAGCCQIIVCESCITHVNNKKRSFIRRCPNCARDVQLPAGLVRIGGEIDLDSALLDDALLVGEIIPESDAPAAVAEAPVEAPADENARDENNAPIEARDAPPDADPKVRALLQLLRGEAPIDCLTDQITAPYVTGLLQGRRDVEWPADRPKKFLIFTMHSESTNMLSGVLTRERISHVILRGTREHKVEAIEKLRTDTPVMLVTQPKDCGGINLPFISTMVFYHRVLDRNVESQVAARGQRLGREFNYEIVSILNEAEIVQHV